MKYQYVFWLLNLYISAFSIDTPSAITYGLCGRLGNSLLSCYKALWIAYKYKLNFAVRDFEYLEYLELDNIPLRANGKQFQHKVHCFDETKITFVPNNGTLYTIDFRAHVSDWSDYNKGFLPLTHDQKFIDILRKLIKPKYPLKLVDLPEGMISIAVHIRKGGGFDAPLLADERIPSKPVNKKNYPDYYWPLVFLPDSFYFEYINQISELFDDKPLYVHIFTDDQNPVNFVKNFKKFYNKPNITFGYRKHDNFHNKHVLEDFFSITKFDCLIRGESTFVKAAQILGDFSLVIYPTAAHWENTHGEYTLIVDKVTMKRK